MSEHDKTGGQNKPDSSSDADERLAILLHEVLSIESAAEQREKLDQLAAANPEFEEELRQLYATASIVDDISLFQSALEETLVPTDSSTDVKGFSGLQVGDYKLGEEIGRGGMGVVYRAQQRSLDRTVALKMIPNAAFASKEDLARLRAEALAAGGLSHPNIVPVYDVGEHDGQPWFSMQLLDGETLSQKLASGPMKATDAVELLIPVVDAIGAAHRSGILHRDLKPSNILITKDGTPFVTDFGLAKRVPQSDRSQSMPGSSASDGITQTGAILGTPAWMSPEQAAGQTASIDPTTDIYSLGAVLFAMLTGRPPFQAANPLDTLLMVMEQDPPAMRVLNSSIDQDLEMIVLKCLQKPRDLRYSNAESLACDLRAWLNHEPVSARSSTFANVMTRLFRESHHAAILQNWGLLWMWHSLVLLILCFVTNAFQLNGVTSRWPYVSLWVIGLGLWAAIFWNLRHRSGRLPLWNDRLLTSGEAV